MSKSLEGSSPDNVTGDENEQTNSNQLELGNHQLEFENGTRLGISGELAGKAAVNGKISDSEAPESDQAVDDNQTDEPSTREFHIKDYGE